MSVSQSPAVAPPRRRRWPRRLLVCLLVVVGLPAAYFFYNRWSRNADLDRAIAETDALDPVGGLAISRPPGRRTGMRRISLCTSSRCGA